MIGCRVKGTKAAYLVYSSVSTESNAWHTMTCARRRASGSDVVVTVDGVSWSPPGDEHRGSIASPGEPMRFAQKADAGSPDDQFPGDISAASFSIG